VVIFIFQVLYLQRRNPQYSKIGVWVSPRPGLDMVVRRKFQAPFKNQTLVIKPRANHITDQATLAHNKKEHTEFQLFQLTVLY
jgi:hypothetical protein